MVAPDDGLVINRRVLVIDARRPAIIVDELRLGIGSHPQDERHVGHREEDQRDDAASDDVINDDAAERYYNECPP